MTTWRRVDLGRRSRNPVPRRLVLLGMAGGLLVGLPSGAAAQAGGGAEIPLAIREGRMVIPGASADGAELSFLVSTGSSVTVLSESGAARIGDGGATIGGVAVAMGSAVTVPDADLTVDGRVMDGLVSTSTLRDFDVLFDVPGGRLLLRPLGPEVSWPGVALSEPLPLRVYHGVVLSLDVEVEGTRYPAMLELGAPALLVNEAVMAETGAADGTAALTVGAVTFPGVPMEVSDNPVLERFSPNGDGFVIVGTPLVQDCAVAVSWVHREVRTCVR